MGTPRKLSLRTQTLDNEKISVYLDDLEYAETDAVEKACNLIHSMDYGSHAGYMKFYFNILGDPKYPLNKSYQSTSEFFIWYNFVKGKPVILDICKLKSEYEIPKLEILLLMRECLKRKFGKNFEPYYRIDLAELLKDANII